MLPFITCDGRRPGASVTRPLTVGPPTSRPRTVGAAPRLWINPPLWIGRGSAFECLRTTRRSQPPRNLAREVADAMWTARHQARQSAAADKATCREILYLPTGYLLDPIRQLGGALRCPGGSARFEDQRDRRRNAMRSPRAETRPGPRRVGRAERPAMRSRHRSRHQWCHRHVACSVTYLAKMRALTCHSASVYRACRSRCPVH